MMMGFRTADSLEDFHARRLEWFETMLRGGSAIAIPATLQYCSKNALLVPSWLVGPAALYCAELLQRDIPKKQGRSTNLVDRYRQDMTDYARWAEVKSVREKQIEMKQEVNYLRDNPKKASPGRLEDREKMLKWVGRSLRRAYECASMLLAESSAFGGPDAMQSSYLTVEKINRCQSQPLRYHMLDEDFLASIGIAPASCPRRRVRKVVALYDLTL
jgi:hypothetical protein